MKKEDKKIKPRIVFGAVGIILCFGLLVTAILLYRTGEKLNVVETIASKLPYPAAIVGFKNIITYGELKNNLTAVKNFYESQDYSETGFRVDFSTEDGQKRLKIKEKNVLTKLIENKIIKKLAQDRKISVTPDQVSEEVNRKLQEYGNQENFEKEMRRLYNWSVKDFEEKIVRPDMYKRALENKIKISETDQLNQKNKIKNALEELNSGKPFSEVAQKFSEGESAENKGDLGWFSSEQMVPELAVTAFATEKNATSEIIESSVGLHIIRVNDKKIEDGVEKINISQIFVRNKNFSDWLLEEEKNIRISIPLAEYYWDSSVGEVKFSDNKMEKFEEEITKNFNGDISVLF